MVKFNRKKIIPKLLEQNIEYFREENDGYLTLVPSAEKGLKDEIFNPTVKYILASCDGKKSIGDIISEMSNMYPDVEREKIAGDVYSTLRFFKQVEIIDLGGESLIMNSIYKIGNGYTVETINEENYQEIVDFILSSKEQAEIFHDDVFHRPCNDDELELSIRFHLFSFSSEFYFLKKNSEIRGLLSIITRPLKNSSASFINYLTCLDKSVASDFLGTVIANLNTFTIHEITKIVLNLEEETETHLLDVLSEASFVKEAYLKNEVNGNSLYRMVYMV